MQQSYLSYWEKDSWFNPVDIAVVGSGIVGLSSAYFIKKKYPNRNVTVFERGFLPHGATTRNAGFSCFGSPGEILSDIRQSGKEKAYSLVKERFDGLAALLELHGPEALGYEHLGGYEVFKLTEDDAYEACCNQVEMLNTDLQEVLNIKSPVYAIYGKDKSRALGFRQVEGMFFNAWEGQLHSGKLIQSLVKKCREVGVEIITGLGIAQFTSHLDSVYLLADKDVEFKASQLVIATNGFARQLLPNEAIIPARGQVLVTSPIQDLALKGSFHHNEGFDYFRNIGNRVLIGGGRNMDTEGEETFSMDRNEKIYQYLLHLLKEVIIPGNEFTIDTEWSGVMGIGKEKEKSPIIREVQPNIFVAARMGGMGVALGTNVGKKVAEII